MLVSYETRDGRKDCGMVPWHTDNTLQELIFPFISHACVISRKFLCYWPWATLTDALSVRESKAMISVGTVLTHFSGICFLSRRQTLLFGALIRRLFLHCTRSHTVSIKDRKIFRVSPATWVWAMWRIYITRPSLKQKILFVTAGNTGLLVYAVVEQVKAKKGHRTLSNITPSWSPVCVCEAMMCLHKTDEASARKDIRLHGLPFLKQNNLLKSYATSPAHFFFSLYMLSQACMPASLSFYCYIQLYFYFYSKHTCHHKYIKFV